MEEKYEMLTASVHLLVTDNEFLNFVFLLVSWRVGALPGWAGEDG